MSDLAVVPRPGMRDYRARKPATVACWYESVTGACGVTVHRTHDLGLAEGMAIRAALLHWQRARLTAGEQVWMRERTEGWERVSCDKSGAIPCVVFRVVS